jgi:hypothetical protein
MLESLAIERAWLSILSLGLQSILSHSIRLGICKGSQIANLKLGELPSDIIVLPSSVWINPHTHVAHCYTHRQQQTGKTKREKQSISSYQPRRSGLSVTRRRLRSSQKLHLEGVNWHWKVQSSKLVLSPPHIIAAAVPHELQTQRLL